MRSWLEHDDVAIEDPDVTAVADLTSAGRSFWLDVEGPSNEVIDHIAHALDLHPLAVEDSKEFDQRGKLVVYGDVAMVVGFGLDTDAGRPVEVHVYLTENFIVTIRKVPSAPLEALHRTGAMRELLGGDSMRIIHQLVTALHDDYPPYIDRLQERLDLIETDMLREPRDPHVAEITEIRQTTEVLRRTLTPGRDLAARASVIPSMPGAVRDSDIYASDLADELALVVGDLAALSDRCLAALGLHASLVSNRQAAASQQLAVVATVFLPITFVVGFFGMNFDFLVNDFEQGWLTFVLFGVLLNVAGAGLTLWWLRRRGWR